jgi:D-alanyl-D-alanine dipeptidase
LPRISDLEAISFEYNAENAINTDGLTPIAALALTRFKRAVSSVGGTMILTSAYRPMAYQEHLQAVWDKWMLELRNNHDEECQTLKAEVEEEFNRHQLLVRQRPALFSDHTRGIAFDASILLPRSARWKRRRTSIDALARTAGIRRPYRSLDPVHFRLAKI